MKILVFTGGLGNQIWGYAFYNYLKENYKKEKIYGVYSSQKMNEHYGLEINKYFDVCLPKTNCWVNILTILFYLLKK